MPEITSTIAGGSARQIFIRRARLTCTDGENRSQSWLVDRDVIRISHGEDFYRRERPFRNLHIAAERNDVHLMSIRITYLNGFAENWSIDRLIRAGSETVIDLRGDRSYLRQIEMVYRSRPSFKGQAVVRVFGAVGGR